MNLQPILHANIPMSYCFATVPICKKCFAKMTSSTQLYKHPNSKNMIDYRSDTQCSTPIKELGNSFFTSVSRMFLVTTHPSWENFL